MADEYDNGTHDDYSHAPISRDVEFQAANQTSRCVGIGFTAAFVYSTMTFGGQNAGIRFPVISVDDRTLAVMRREWVP